ncbi:MAG: hypothetical protein HY560_01330 [Gemmatimonadetes bacterium]|nr:hypothetical protein [Gemmatimonadota bacterium]
MNEEVFNLEVRQFLKKFGITAQREIEKAVDAAIKSGRLKGNERIKARAALVLEGLPGEIKVEGEIALA